MEHSKFKSNFYSGVFYTSISRYFNIFVNIFITAILARLLSPFEFGVVAVVTVFTTFFQMLSQLGVGPAVIQNKTLTKKDISNIFKFMIIVAILLGITFFLFSYVIAEFYDNSVYIVIGQMLTLSIFFNTINTIPRSLMAKQKKFKTIGFITVGASLASGIIAIILAYMGFSYYSIIIKSIVLALLTFILSFKFSKLAIMPGFDLNGIKKIRSYSSYQFLFNFINYFSRNLDNILIGKFISPSALGYYDKAYKLMMYPVQNLTHVITPVLHPLLSDFQDNKNKIYSVYKKITKFLAMLGVPICVVLYFYASEIILVIYGSQWLPIVPTFKILAITILIQIILSSTGSIFQAAGRTDMLFLSGLLSALFMVIGISIGVYLGELQFVAIGILLAMSINFIQAFYLLISRVLKERLVDFFLNFKIPLYISFILIASNILLLYYLSFDNYLYKLIVGLIINFMIWLICIFIFKENEFMKINSLIRRLKMIIKKRKISDNV